MTSKPTAPRHTLLALALLTWLAGCGPGTGGTGTGDSPAELAAFGAAPTELCQAAFATQLLCTGSAVVPGQTPPTAPATGTGLVVFADLALGGNVTLEFNAQGARLQARCSGLLFTGEWGLAASGDTRFFGGYSLGESTRRLLAALAVQTPADGTGNVLSVVLRDAAGQPLLGPVALQRVAHAPVDPAPCP